MNRVWSGRDATIDIAKGIAIIAIVTGHVLRGLASSGILEGGSPTFDATDRALYMAHVSVFAFLAGLFVVQGVQRGGARQYLRNRLALFLYLYVIWQVIQVGVKLATGAFVNSVLQVSDLWSLWKPEGQLWFLPFLMIVTTLAVILRPWRATWLSAIGFLAVATASILTWGFDGIYVGTRGTSLFVFFFAGAGIGYQRLCKVTAACTRLVLVAVSVSAAGLFVLGLAFTVAAPPTVDDATRTLPETFWGVFVSTTGSLGVLSVSALLARSFKLPWLEFIGKRSLEIFLAHIIAASGARVMLSLLGVQDAAIHVVAGSVAGIALPMALWWLTARMGLPWLFRLPDRRVQQTEPASARA